MELEHLGDPNRERTVDVDGNFGNPTGLMQCMEPVTSRAPPRKRMEIMRHAGLCFLVGGEEALVPMQRKEA
jgi:hypothetical protein